jgi:hypothetical protein
VIAPGRRPLIAAAALLLLAGCGSSGLPYKPEQQPAGARLGAAYQVTGDRLRIEVDTDGRRLEDVRILRADGSELPAQTIDNAPLVSSGSGVGFGIGVGGGSWGGRSGVGVGTGVSMGIPVGGGSTRVEGSSYAYFPLAEAGASPWRVRVKVAGADPALIVIGGDPPPR